MRAMFSRNQKIWVTGGHQPLRGGAEGGASPAVGFNWSLWRDLRGLQQTVIMEILFHGKDTHSRL